jgi:NAD(P)H-binding
VGVPDQWLRERELGIFCSFSVGGAKMRICIVGASGKLGRYMVQHALAKGYEVVGVCRQQSIGKLDAFKGRITIFPGMTNDREVIKRAVADCDGVLTILVPWGMNHYATGTAQAVLDYAKPGARLVFSCGWHITRDGQDVYSSRLKAIVWAFGGVARLFRIADLDDQVEACARVFASDKRWTVVRGSDLEEGDSEGLPVWSQHVGDPILSSNRTRRVDFALFMVEALTNDALIHEAPAIVGCQTPSARAYANKPEGRTLKNEPSYSKIKERSADPAERVGCAIFTGTGVRPAWDEFGAGRLPG